MDRGRPARGEDIDNVIVVAGTGAAEAGVIAGPRRRLPRAVLPIVAAALMVAAVRALPAAAWLREIADRAGALGPPGLLLFALAYAGAAVLFVPGSVLTIGAGVVFGVARGTAAVSIGSTLGAAAAFLAARHLARARVERWAASSPRFAAIDRAVGREGWRIVLLTRLSPVFPYNLLNYLYGLTGVGFMEYLAASWIGMLPGTLLYVSVGAAGREAAGVAGGAARSPAGYAVAALGLLATAALALSLARLARRALEARTGSGA